MWFTELAFCIYFESKTVGIQMFVTEDLLIV